MGKFARSPRKEQHEAWQEERANIHVRTSPAAADLRRKRAPSTTLFCESDARFRAATYTFFLLADLPRTNSDSGVDLATSFLVRLKKENMSLSFTPSAASDVARVWVVVRARHGATPSHPPFRVRERPS